ncbi:darcynin family protein [Microbulbifer hainanensis]|uniref:darcynin family protein n=1 Tax=Microbulbifer hainanensis TaxID=2735675 RepID=UPI0029C02901|nr:darcynin family protein [Microbulbifer hainanensis]
MAKYTVFMHLNATRHWLSLSREQRNAFFGGEVAGILARYPLVRVRFYDVEAFSGRCSDIAVFETDSLRDYRFVIDALRDSEVYTRPYFEVVDIFPAVEDGFEEYERQLGDSA